APGRPNRGSAGCPGAVRGAGRHREQDARAHPDGRDLLDPLVAHAPADAGGQVLVGQRVQQPAGRDPHGRAVGGQQAEQLAGPPHASTAAAATRAGADTVSATAIVWSSRSPVPVTTTTRSTSAASAASRASSRSVASLAAGWRCSGTPAASAAASAPGSTES